MHVQIARQSLYANDQEQCEPCPCGAVGALPLRAAALPVGASQSVRTESVCTGNLHGQLLLTDKHHAEIPQHVVGFTSIEYIFLHLSFLLVQYHLCTVIQ